MATRRIGRGQPIQELTKGSLEYTMRAIRSAFYDQHRDTETEFLYVEEIFDTYIIVVSSRLATSEYYRVPYERDGEEYVFADRSEWEIVELTYQPQTLGERLREKTGKRIIETMPTAVRLAEAQEGKPRLIYGDGATADVVNGNSRRYSERVLIEAVAEAKTHLHESLGQGRAILLGEEDHPADKRQPPRLTETIVVWEDIDYDRRARQVKLRGRMVENSRGKDAIITMDAGVLPGISLRGYGESELIEEDGQVIEEVLWLRFTGFDLVMTPAFEDAAVSKLESRGERNMGENTKKTKEVNEAGQQPAANGDIAPPISAAALREQYPDIVEKLLEEEEVRRELEEKRKRQMEEQKRRELEQFVAERDQNIRQVLGLSETDDIPTAVRDRIERLQELETEDQKRRVTTYIEEQVGGLKQYPDFLRNQLREAVVRSEPKSVEEAKQEIIDQRAIFDGILSELKLRQKGYGLQVLGPVLESETGVPEFARAAFEITEALRAHGYAKRRKLHEKDALTPAEAYAVKYLKRFDANYKHKLIEESRQFEEAETTADLSLPYSVLRSIAEEAYPDLIAANVFDFDTIETTPTRVYYESQFAGESGYEVTVTGSGNVNAAAFDTWYDLPSGHKRIVFDSVSMQPNGGGTPFEYGTDYLIDFEGGRYMLLSGGSMATSTDYDLDYTYHAVRKGEGATIERAKAQLAFTTLEAEADRLALQITAEAILFSRSQVGWDAAMRSIDLLVKELRLLIERNLLGLALSQALTVANNSGGTWNSASDTLTDFVQLILNAKTKVENRYYSVDSIVMSKTRGNDLILWDGFTAAGTRPGFALNNAPGFLGDIGEVPVFTSTEMPDSFVLVHNRELVMHRVYQAMELKGPFPVYSEDQLVDSEEYFVREFNGTISPIAGKGAVVRVS